MDSALEGYNISTIEFELNFINPIITVENEEKNKITIDTYRKLTNDYQSTDDEVTTIIINIHKLSNLVYDLLNDIK